MAMATIPRRSPNGRVWSPITRKLIGLRPGSKVLVSTPGDDLAIVRKRMSSRVRTATLQTGRRYRMQTEGGRLYVVCEAVTEER